MALERTGIKLSSKLHKEAHHRSPEAVLKAIEAFEQYRSENGVQKPAACLLRAIQEEWEPNIAQEAVTPEEREFDEWYSIAIQQRFVLNLPKNYLGEVGGEMQVRVKDSNAPGGYINMGWLAAKAKMEPSVISS